MRIQTDVTLAAYATAATDLDKRNPEALRLTLSLLGQATNDDDAADATPDAVISVAKGIRPAVAVSQALKCAKLDRLKSDSTVSTDPADLPELPHSAPKVPFGALFESAMGQIAPNDRAILSALARDGLSRHDAGTYTDASNVLHHGPKFGKGYANEYLDRAGAMASGETSEDLVKGAQTHKTKGVPPSLKVSVIATALGADRVHSATAGLEHKALACKAMANLMTILQPRTHAVASQRAMHAGQSVVTSVTIERMTVAYRASSYLAYVTRDCKFYGQAVWQNDARPAGIDPSTYRDLGYRPSWGPAPILPMRQIPGVSGGIAWGHGVDGSGEVAMGDKDHLGQESAKARARFWQATDSAAIAHAVRYERGQSLCTLPAWDTLPDGVSGPLTAPVCGCGPTKGTALESVLWSASVDPNPHAGDVTPSSYGESGKDGRQGKCAVTVYLHPLTPCPSPVTHRADKDGVICALESARCACKAKRGILVNGSHRAR